MPKTMLHQLAQSGAAVGQVPTWDGDEYAPADSGSARLPWFDVTDPTYGADPTGATLSRVAINAAIADFNAAGRGVLYMPGHFKVDGTCTVITARGRILGDGSGDAYGNAASILESTSTTDPALQLDQAGMIVDDVCFTNNTGAETGGAALYVTHGERNQYRNVVVYGFYDNIHIENGGAWTASSCFFTKPARYSLNVEFPASPDGGDQHLVNCDFYAKDRNATAAVHLTSGGGLKVSNCKVNTNSGTGYYTYGLDLDIPSGVATSVLLVSDTSIENCTTNGIRVRTSGSANYDMISIGGSSEIAFYTSGTGSAIDINSATVGNIRAVVLSGLAMRANPARSSTPAVNLTNVNNVTIGDRVIEGFGSAYASTGGSGIVDGMSGGVPTSRLVSAGTGLTGGGDLSADRTIAADIGTSSSQVAAGNHTHAGSSSGEALMQDAVTGPPVPIETEARDDWLYQG